MTFDRLPQLEVHLKNRRRFGVEDMPSDLAYASTAEPCWSNSLQFPNFQIDRLVGTQPPSVQSTSGDPKRGPISGRELLGVRLPTPGL